MDTLCTICARGGSVGVKNKNIRKLRGKPLIAHSILQAKQTQLFDLIAVSSDSHQILNIAQKWGANTLVERPHELATHTASKLPTIQHAVLEIERCHRKKYDYIVDLDATSPLRTVDDILLSFKMLHDHPDAQNLVTACLARKSPYFNMLELDSRGFARLSKQSEHVIGRRQDAPVCYDMNASIYIWKRDALFSSARVVTDHTLLYVMPEDRSVDIDNPIDWQLVALLAKNRKDFEYDRLPELI